MSKVPPKLSMPCPECGQPIRYTEDMAGRKAQCKKCSSVVRLKGADKLDFDFMEVLDAPAEPKPARFDGPVDMPSEEPRERRQVPNIPMDDYGPRFPFLRVVAGGYAISGVLMLLIPIAWAISEGEGASKIALVLVIIMAAQLSIFSFAAAEGIRVGLSIEQTNRKISATLAAILKSQHDQ